MSKVRLGIIGYGNIGSQHGRAIRDGKTPQVDLTAVADIDEKRLELAKSMFGEQLTTFTSASELIHSGLVDAVLIAVPIMRCVCFLRGRFYERNSLSHEHRSTARYARQRRGYPWASCWRPSPPKRQERNERKGKFTMKLYFGNAVTTATTLMILALLGYIGVSVWNRGNIACWGRRTLLLLVFGLVVSCFAAARDGLDKTIQHTIDGSCAPGVFPLVSVPTVVGCAGALLIVVAAIATPIARTQKMRELWFYVMSGGAVLKIASMEIARLVL